MKKTKIYFLSIFITVSSYSQAVKVTGSGGSSTDTTALSNRINTKLNIADTNLMLLPYRDAINAHTDSIINLRTTIGSIPIKIVYEIYTVGNSITANGGYQTRLNILLNDTSWNIVNYSVSGHTVYDMLSRFGAVVSAKPEYVIILGGINDIIAGRTAVAIEADLQSMYTAATNVGIKVVAMTVLPFGTNAFWTAPRQTVLDNINTWIATTATNVDYVVDSYTALEDPGNADALNPAYDNGDGLHPNSAGHTVLGNTIYFATNFTKSTSYKKLTFTGNYTISQDIASSASPFFKGLTTTDFRVVNYRKGSIPFPKMTTGLVNAIASPEEGSMAYDSTVHYPKVYNGSAWVSLSGDSLQNVAARGSSFTGTLNPNQLYVGVNSGINYPNGAGTTIIAQLANATASGTSVIGTSVLDATNNYRIGMFADNTNSLTGLSVNGTSGVPPFVIRSGSLEYLRILNTGNVGIGISPSARLHVVSTTEQLRVGYDGSNYMNATVTSAGNTTMALTGTSPSWTWPQIMRLTGGYTAPTWSPISATTSTIALPSGILTGLSITPSSIHTSNVVARNSIVMADSYAPTSGSLAFNELTVSPTINQVGATGISRGVYILPILTAAADFRGIEIANNSGYGIYQSGASAKNYFNGNIGIGQTTPTAYLHIKAGTTAASTAPLKFTSGSLNTTAEAGAVEFLTDKFYGTITTSAVRKMFTQSIDATLGTQGTATNDNASAGNVGEETNAVVSTYANYTTTATYQNVTSITLTAGDWDLSAFYTYSSNGATITAASNAVFAISTTTASAAGATEGVNISYVPQAALLGTSKFSDAITPYRVSISGSTTYYLNTQATFTLGNPQYVGSIRGRRIR